MSKNKDVNGLPGKNPPLQVHIPGLEMEDYLPYKQKKTENTDKYYVDKLALINVERDNCPNIR